MGLVETSVLVMDCSEPERLPRFYTALLDGEVYAGAGTDRVEIVGNGGTHMAFRRDLNATPPSWPRPDDSLQTHLDLIVAEGAMDEVERRIISLGGRALSTADTVGPQGVRLYSDPAGHPFSLRTSRVSGPKTG
ncbi:VOC family protein [Streptomyces sp. GC420]|uniref:VOC family protein n=1 Tax=Streptomyces sp. GC420 TaxID=2697568 RepID=UPI001414FE2D|nr:VOC family protein [Streptomyces sp. GC420]NBM15719.1 VOC family protein [Streptomyces sp. GC420]